MPFRAAYSTVRFLTPKHDHRSIRREGSREGMATSLAEVLDERMPNASGRRAERRSGLLTGSNTKNRLRALQGALGRFSKGLAQNRGEFGVGEGCRRVVHAERRCGG